MKGEGRNGARIAGPSPFLLYRNNTQHSFITTKTLQTK
jgi:hypothetical protein